MVVFHTVDVVLHVHSERNSVQTLLADHTAETTRVIRPAQSLQDHLHDEVSTHKAFLSRLLEAGVQEVFFTVHFSINIIESLSS